MTIQQYIAINPNVRFGKPVLKGTGTSVYDVLNCLANGMTPKEMIADFSELSEGAIKACLFYAADRESYIHIL